MLFELELAHECKIGADSEEDTFEDYLRKFRYDLYLALGGVAGTSKQNLFRDSGFGETLKDERAGIQGIDELSENIQLLIGQYFPNVRVDKLDVLQYPDTNEISVQIYYTIINTGITDQVEINFA